MNTPLNQNSALRVEKMTVFQCVFCKTWFFVHKFGKVYCPKCEKNVKIPFLWKNIIL